MQGFADQDYHLSCNFLNKYMLQTQKVWKQFHILEFVSALAARILHFF